MLDKYRGRGGGQMAFQAEQTACTKDVRWAGTQSWKVACERGLRHGGRGCMALGGS